MTRHFFDWHQLELGDWEQCLARAQVHAARRDRLDLRAAGRALGMVFFNPSLRTRASMELAAQELGARCLTLNPGQGTWSFEWREGAVMDGALVEHVRDAFGVLSSYVDAIGVRVFASLKDYAEDRDEVVFDALRRASKVPLINLESAFWHPCQALADGLALRSSLRETRARKFVLSWCYHPKALPMAVPNSALTTAARLGMNVTVLHPPGFALDPAVMAYAAQLATSQGGAVVSSDRREEAFDGAQVVYAKAWGGVDAYLNPGKEAAAREAHRDWRLGAADLARGADPFFMHCLPVRRNVEVDDAAIDGPRSLTQMQALNRLHAQKAILEWVWNL